MKRVSMRGWIASLLAAMSWFPAALAADDADADHALARARMVREIEAMARDTRSETGRERFADPVMRAMGKVERHRFIPNVEPRIAYRNSALPIGSGQTISQPFIVALSTDLIDPMPHHVVLEVGTGSGYQAAVLAELVSKVYTIEIVETLGREAAARLASLGYRNIDVRVGDGYQGWPDKAPFNAIIVTAGAPFIPDPLLAQLAPGGKMVIPVDKPLGGQELVLIEKRPDGSLERRNVLSVRFVPLTGPSVRERNRK